MTASAGRGEATVRRPSASSLLAATVGVALAVLSLPATPTAAATSTAAATTGPRAVSLSAEPDVDGDGAPDIVVGSPAEDGERGAVDLHLSSAPARQLTAADVPGRTPTVRDRFGAAVTVRDIDGDGFDDVVVGAPGEGGVGAVHIFFGSAGGVSATRVVTIAGAHPGDRFGAALQTDHTAIPPTLWIGAPGRAVGGHAAAGAAAHWGFVVDGASVTTRWLRTVTQDSRGIPGIAETGDQFGEVLFAFDNELMVGVPHEDVGGARDAGLVEVIRPASAREWTRNSAGVAGVPGAGERFGASVSSDAIGIPGATVAGHAGAGAVQLFNLNARDEMTPSMLLTQNSTYEGHAVPGAAEAGDRFGASLGFTNQGALDAPSIAVGAPGEDIGSTANAGTVTVLATFRDCGSQCPPILYYRGHGLVGPLTAGDLVGASLTTIHYEFDSDNQVFDVLIGAPGVDSGGVHDAGNLFDTYNRGVNYSPLRPQAGVDYGRALAN